MFPKMDSKTAEYLSKLMLENDEDDMDMFSTRWCREAVEVDDKQLDTAVTDAVSKDTTIELSDDVTFDPYLTFKLLMQIMYGLRDPNSLTVDQATNVYYYSNKYQIKVWHLDTTIYCGRAQLYNLADFKNKLDKVKLAFDEHNTIQFWDLTVKFGMKKLQEQVRDHLKTVAPKNDYPTDLLIALVSGLQAKKKN